MSEAVGLDIGSHSIKLVGINMTHKGPFLTHVGIKEIPHRVEKEDPGFVSEIIKAVYKEAGLKPGKVRLTLSGPGIHIRRFTIPSMPKAELKEAVRWEMKSQIPYPIETAQTDFHIIGEFVEKDVKKLDLVGVTCPVHLIDRTLSIAVGAGLKPIHLTVGPFAVWNILLALRRLDKDEVIALIDLGAEKTGIYLFKDGSLQFSRETTPGGEDMTRATMEGIHSEEDPDFIYEQAEKIKKAMGTSPRAFDEKNGNPSINQSKIPFLVRPVLERLIAEIGRSFDYYKNQFQVERINRILLTGGGANLNNVSSYLSEELRLPVERFDPFKEILFDANRIDSQVLDQIGPSFTIALGIAVPESTQIELLPVKEPIWSRARMEKFIPGLSACMALLIFFGIVWNMSGQVSALKKERDEKMAKAKTLELLQTNLTLLKEKENQIKQNLSLLSSSMGAHAPFRRTLREIAHIVPSDVTFTLLSIQSKAKDPKGEPKKDAGNELQMKGLVFGNDSHCLTLLAKTIEGLERSPLFGNVKLLSADETKSYNEPGVEFEIVCDIEYDNPPNPSSAKGVGGI